MKTIRWKNYIFRNTNSCALIWWINMRIKVLAPTRKKCKTCTKIDIISTYKEIHSILTYVERRTGNKCNSRMVNRYMINSVEWNSCNFCLVQRPRTVHYRAVQRQVMNSGMNDVIVHGLRASHDSSCKSNSYSTCGNCPFGVGNCVRRYRTMWTIHYTKFPSKWIESVAQEQPLARLAQTDHQHKTTMNM